jgi:hypothetical protein
LVLVGLPEPYLSFWAGRYREAMVFTLIIRVLLWRSLASPHAEGDQESHDEIHHAERALLDAPRNVVCVAGVATADPHPRVLGDAAQLHRVVRNRAIGPVLLMGIGGMTRVGQAAFAAWAPIRRRS